MAVDDDIFRQFQDVVADAERPADPSIGFEGEFDEAMGQPGDRDQAVARARQRSMERKMRMGKAAGPAEELEIADEGAAPAQMGAAIQRPQGYWGAPHTQMDPVIRDDPGQGAGQGVGETMEKMLQQLEKTNELLEKLLEKKEPAEFG